MGKTGANINKEEKKAHVGCHRFFLCALDEWVPLSSMKPLKHIYGYISQGYSVTAKNKSQLSKCLPCLE